MANKQCILLAVAFLVSAGSCAKDFPADKIPRCNYGDTDCIRNSAEFILQSYKDGIPELNVPRLDPIDLSDIKIENPGVVNVNMVLSGGQMSGLSKARVNYVKGFSMEFDPEEFNEVEVLVPSVTILSPYNIDGKVFLFPIKGAGNTNFTFENLTLRFKFRAKPISRDDQLYFESKDMDLQMNTTKLYLNFDNLFNGDKFLCEQTNGLLNRRSEDVFRELRTRIESSFSAEITERVNEAFGNFPYSDYFLPGPIPKMKVVPEVRNSLAKAAVVEEAPAAPANN